MARHTKALTKEQAELLEKFRTAPHEGYASGYSLKALRSAMVAPFHADTLGKALQGLPIWDLHHSWVVAWIERYLQTPVVEKEESPAEQPEDVTDQKEAGTTRTVRGSR